MEWYEWLLLIFVVIPIGMWLFSLIIGPFIAFQSLLWRTTKDKWARGPARKMKEDAVKIYESGLEWQSRHAQYKKDVHIVNKGLNLYGEYYDLGGDKCAIILPGRREGLMGSYDFAQPYTKKGWSVLLIDPRAHGYSDGTFNTAGFEEYSDNMAWANFLREECGVQTVVYHGVCIGCMGGLLAAVNPQCPDVVKGMVADGMFETFAKSTYHHMRKYHIPSPPGLDVVLIDMWMRIFTGHTMFKGPIHYIDRMEKPLLMLHSREDIFSTPKQAQKLFDKAKTQRKQLVWFEKGYHSQLRLADPELYDAAVGEFLESLTTVAV